MGIVLLFAVLKGLMAVFRLARRGRSFEPRQRRSGSGSTLGRLERTQRYIRLCVLDLGNAGIDMSVSATARAVVGVYGIRVFACFRRLACVRFAIPRERLLTASRKHTVAAAAIPQGMPTSKDRWWAA